MKSGPDCSKLTTSLVNVLLKFQTLISNLHYYFLLKKYEKLLHCTAKASLLFSTKNIGAFSNKASQAIQSPRTVPFFLLVSLLDGYSFPNVLVKGIVAFEH